MVPKFSSITSAGYNKNSDIIILIHDFTANGYTGWIKVSFSAIVTCKNISKIYIEIILINKK